MKQNLRFLVVAAIFFSAALTVSSCKKDKDKFFTVEFVTNGGSDVDAQVIKAGSTATAPNVTKEGYTLVGWYRDNNTFANKYDFDAPVTANIMLYAKWEEAAIVSVDLFTVEFVTNGADDVDEQTIEDGGTATEPTVTRDGYTLDGWFTDDTFTNRYDFATPVTADIMLYAKWDEIILHLLTEIYEVNENDDQRSEYKVIFEYDAQNRITEIINQGKREYFENSDWNEEWSSIQTLIYNGAGDLIQYIDKYEDIITFTRDGNKIIVTDSWWEESDADRSMILELNAQGLPVKLTQEAFYSENDWWKDIQTFQYQGGNVIQVTIKSEQFWYDEYYDEEHYRLDEAIVFVTYDDKKSPLYYSATPKWFYYLNELIMYGQHNNIKSVNQSYDDDAHSTTTYDYNYNDAGFPVSVTSTQRNVWYNENEDGELEEQVEEWSNSQTFKYNEKSAASKGARSSAPKRTNVGSKDMRDRNNFPFHNNRFGSRIENFKK